MAMRINHLSPFYNHNIPDFSFHETLNQLKATHNFILKSFTQLHNQPLLINLLTKLLHFPGDNLRYARNLFDQIPTCKNRFIWTSLIHNHVLHSQFTHSILLYAKMHTRNVSPSEFTFSSVLNACARIPLITEGKQVHARVIQSGFLRNKFVNTALLDVYAKSGFTLDARNVFDTIDDKDVVAWTAMICGYTKMGMMDEAQILFDKMDERNVVSMTCMVAGYANCGDMEAAKKVYDCMVERNSVTWVAMIAGYGKCGDVSEARKVFDDDVSGRDGFCWGAMVACYAQNGFAREAIEMYRRMREENVRMTEVAMVGAISACTQLENIEMAMALAEYMEEGCCDRTVFVSNALIHMHAKCGSMEQAQREFDTIKEKDVISYTTMITALSDHGKTREALNLFLKMQNEGVKPNQITFIGVLHACSQSGLIEEGCKYFELMTRVLTIKPLTQHLTCMVNLLGKAGEVEKAYNMIVDYNIDSDAGVWGALLGACKIHGNAELGEIAAMNLFEMEPEDTGNYVVLANTYASMNNWDDAERVRKLSSETRKRKSSGCSWISTL